MKEPILATDGANSVILNQKIARIGTLHTSRFILQEGKVSMSVMVEFDFEQDGRKDLFFFEEGKLKYNSVHESDKPPGVFNAYNDCIYVKHPVTLSTFCNLVITEYLRFALGFADENSR